MTTPNLPRILYIEDTESSRILVSRVLSERYVVLDACEPLEGIELGRETQPDLVLLDINLPQMTGIEVAIRLRSILRQGVPIVAVTADNSPGARERALSAGFDGFLTKPIDIDTIEDELAAFLGGKREQADNAELHLRAYQTDLVERMEARVRELTATLNRNKHLQAQNETMIAVLIHRQSMLEASARISRGVTSILDLQEMLDTAVDIICDEFGLYYSGIFLVSENGTRLELKAGHGSQPDMPAGNFSLPVDTMSTVGRAVLDKRAHLVPDTTLDTNRVKLSLLPDTRSEAALPLMFKDRVLGALTVQSAQVNFFPEDDITALQSLADQVAIAIHNAQLLRQLEAANQELLRSKTFEAIATATGEAIHWVGNKAAPVPGSVNRLREDLLNLLAVFHSLARQNSSGNPLDALAGNIFEEAQEQGIDLPALSTDLAQLPAKRLAALVSLDSMLEDLQIIQNSATTILNIKEDLIGPARQRSPQEFDLVFEVNRIIAEMALPREVLSTEFEAGLPKVFADPRQVDQVFNNLLKNAWEALEGRTGAHIHVSLRRAAQAGYVLACVRDNGPGVPLEVQEKVWVSFYTTKSSKGGTGLGLPACMQIVRQNGGKIWLESKPGEGAAFFVRLPIQSE